MDDVNDLFLHELCTDFRYNYHMDDEEAKRFHTAFSHFHKVMTDINEQWFMNMMYLNENFFNLWNNNSPQEMLNICLEKAVQDSININKSKEQETKEKK
jgi:hypothetical protein